VNRHWVGLICFCQFYGWLPEFKMAATKPAVEMTVRDGAVITFLPRYFGHARHSCRLCATSADYRNSNGGQVVIAFWIPATIQRRKMPAVSPSPACRKCRGSRLNRVASSFHSTVISISVCARVRHWVSVVLQRQAMPTVSSKSAWQKMKWKLELLAPSLTIQSYFHFRLDGHYLKFRTTSRNVRSDILKSRIG